VRPTRRAQRGGIALEPAADGTLTEVLRISEQFAALPFDRADASIVEGAARLKLRQVLSIDVDFDVYRDRTGRPLVDLLRPGAPGRGARPSHPSARRQRGYR
jgi:uncharacterized protein